MSNTYRKDDNISAGNREAQRRGEEKRFRVTLEHVLNGTSKTVLINAYSEREACEEAERQAADEYEAIDASWQMGDRNATMLHDGRGGTPGHRPGFVMIDSVEARDQKDVARVLWLDELTNAWRKGPTSDASGPEGPEGAVCTVRNGDYPLDFGSPGHIKNGICVPDRVSAPTDSMSVADVHAERDEWLRNQWKVGTPQAARNATTPSRDYKRRDGMTLDQLLVEKEKLMRRAYAEHDAYLEKSYRGS